MSYDIESQIEHILKVSNSGTDAIRLRPTKHHLTTRNLLNRTIQRLQRFRQDKPNKEFNRRPLSQRKASNTDQTYIPDA